MIPARLLKECSEELAPILAIIYNKSIQAGKVPDDWKKANVSAVFKKGQRYDPANYRPCLLNLPLLQDIRAHHSQQCDETCGQT